MAFNWRSVEKDPPNLNERVIAANDKFCGEASLIKRGNDLVWMRCAPFVSWPGRAPTHWMHMPQLTTGKEDP